jgi:hypothetical protein
MGENEFENEFVCLLHNDIIRTSGHFALHISEIFQFDQLGTAQIVQSRKSYNPGGLLLPSMPFLELVVSAAPVPSGKNKHRN